MAITAAEVNKLRKMTGAGMMDCKKALVETNGDFEAAVDYLRKKGQKVAAKRADRDATEGVVIAKTTSDGGRGVVVHISCETDFVAKNEAFVSFATEIAQTALENNITSADALLAHQSNGVSLADKITEQIGKIGEKIEVAQFATLSADHVAPYIHANNKVGVLVGLNKGGSEIAEAAKDVAMQVAAMSPVAVDEANVAADVIDRERAIGREKAIAEGKPENIVDKIAEGTVKKFLKEKTLLNQQFVKDGSKTVSAFLKSVDGDLTVTDFKRLSL